MLDRDNQAGEPLGANEGAQMGLPANENQEAPRQGKGRGRGFASMDANKQREIASKGGKAAHAKGTAHEFTSIEAREAGRKGGQARGKRAH
jgi:general stress protein YciG